MLKRHPKIGSVQTFTDLSAAMMALDKENRILIKREKKDWSNKLVYQNILKLSQNQGFVQMDPVENSCKIFKWGRTMWGDVKDLIFKVTKYHSHSHLGGDSLTKNCNVGYIWWWLKKVKAFAYNSHWEL